MLMRRNLFFSVSTVWALTPEGNVYRRFGVSKMNYIGDYWLRIPGLFSVITGVVYVFSVLVFAT